MGSCFFSSWSWSWSGYWRLGASWQQTTNQTATQQAKHKQQAQQKKDKR
jgi:hypothetical protein